MDSRDTAGHDFTHGIVNYHDPREAVDGWALLDLIEPENTTVVFEPHEVRIANAREADVEFSLERTGFTLIRHDLGDIDLFDLDDVKRRYYPVTEALVRGMTGADEVIVFGESLRSDDPNALADTTEVKRLGPAPNAHIDYDEATVRNFVEDIAGPDEAARLTKKRFQLINLWRGVAPVERMPLAVCDASTVKRGDFLHCRLRAPLGPALIGRRSGYNTKYSAAHRWYYFPLMQPDELLVFKLCDSEPDAVQFTVHTSFKDPTSAPAAPPRVSFEIRAICFLPD
jgi:hypothetical protein